MQLEYTALDRAAINRANSLQSTGPKTEAGKQKSSLNALRHRLTGQTVVLPTEDLAAFESFTKTFQDEFQRFSSDLPIRGRDMPRLGRILHSTRSAAVETVVF
jgi:hypothetical protein